MFRLATSLLPLLLLAASAHAERGVQWTPDRLSRLISKDVGGERWAISIDVEDGTAVGNVFRPDGGPPQFVWCWPQSTVDDPVRLRCEGTTGCDAWADLGEVELPASFFSPPSSCETSSTPAAVVGAAGATAAPAGSALRLTPDERRTLISKDVGGLRWAMIYERETDNPSRGGRVSGNVFDPSGGPPQFVACTEEDRTGGNVILSCSGASACGCEPCADTDWTDLPPVTLPASFFDERRCPDTGAPPPGQVAELALDPPAAGAAAFRGSIAIDGNTAAVSDRSALYVFEETAVGWQRVARLAAPGSGDFGRSIAMAGGTIAVGDDGRARIYTHESDTWRLADTLNPQAIEDGRVEVMTDDLLILNTRDADNKWALVTYERMGDTWRELERLRGPEDLELSFFRGVAVYGDTLAAAIDGAPYEGAQFVSFVQLYERQGDAWVLTQRLETPFEKRRSGEYGTEVALEGDTLVVGAPPDRSRRTREDDGAAYLFERKDGAWAAAGKLETCDPEAGRFGSSVSISGDLIVVGATAFNDGGAAGSAYVFERGADGWHETRRVPYADAAPLQATENSGQRAFAFDGSTFLVVSDGGAQAFDVTSAELPPSAACSPPGPEIWPDDDWRVDDPVQHGMNPVLLARARDYAFQDGKNTQAVVVVRHGAIVAEWYEPGRDPSSYAASWSTAKSFSSAVIGIAIDRGDLPGVDVPMTSFYPEWIGTDKQTMTLRHVLTMTSGLDWSESVVLDPSNTSDVAELASTQRDQLAYVLAQPSRYPPGTDHYYSSGDSMLFSGVIEASLGRTFGDYAREVLFDPIGMSTAEWWSDAVGQTLTYCCLDAPSREVARFGLLYARHGRWKDRQVVSEDYVLASLTPVVTMKPGEIRTDAYGFQWWLGPGGSGRYATDGFQARGFDIQRIYVFPKLDLVVVRHGHYEKDPGPPIADPNLFARYPGGGLGNGRGTVPPDTWDDSALVEPILQSIIE